MQDEDRHPKSKLRLVARIAYWLFFLGSLVGVVISMAVFVILERATSSVFEASIPFEILKWYPGYGLMPMISLIASIAILWGALRLNRGSRRDWVLALVILLVIPPLSRGILSWLLLPLTTLVETVGSDNSNITTGWIDRVLTPDAFWLLALVMLLISFKHFTLPAKPYSTRMLLFMIGFVLIIGGSITSYLSYGYIKASDTDYGYTALARDLDYHLYRPNPMPTGKTLVTKFYENSNEEPKAMFGGRMDFISVYIGNDSPLHKPASGGGAILLKQVGVEPEFDTRSEAERIRLEGDDVIELSLESNTFPLGYMVSRPFGENRINILMAKSVDHTLIMFISPGATTSELIDLAERLK
jgi:hypothetical protein